MVNVAFMAQSYTDISRKLQKLEGFAEMNATQLLEVTNMVFVNHNWEAQKKADKQMKQKMSLLTVTLENPGPVQQTAPPWKGESKRRSRLRCDQCTCKEPGHWKNECPHHERTSGGSKKFNPLHKENYQPEPAIQDHFGLAREESD